LILDASNNGVDVMTKAERLNARIAARMDKWNALPINECLKEAMAIDAAMATRVVVEHGDCFLELTFDDKSSFTLGIGDL
jgi:hypothetical protein